MTKNQKLRTSNFELRTNLGFTLVELAIAFSIGILLLSGGVVSYREFNHTQKIKTAGLAVKSALRLTQSKAASGEKPLTTPCTSLLGYEVSFTASTMQTYAKCSEGNGEAMTIPLLSPLVFANPPSPMLFKVLSDGVENPQPITVSGFNKTYELVVTVTGEVQDKKLGGEEVVVSISPVLAPTPSLSPTLLPTLRPIATPRFTFPGSFGTK